MFPELLFGSLLPLLLLIGLGYVAGRWMQVDSLTLAKLGIYFLAPSVTFGAMAQLDFRPSYLLLPLLLLAVGSCISVFVYAATARIFTDSRRNLVAMAASTANTGYFGLPVVLAVAGPDAAGIYLLGNVGISLSESTVGYYLGARSTFSVRDSVKRVLSLPANYAVILGLAWNALDFPLPAAALTWWQRLTGAWIIVGMMLIGAALSQAGVWKASARLTGVMLGVKFLLWPACTWGLALLDREVLGLFEPRVHTLLLIFGIVPMAANVVAFAAQLRLRPAEAASVVLQSTVFAVFYIPLVLWMAGIGANPR
ncbi:AEC family transporter [Ramlibacter sp.]|uniref:AEC family transporter n=1 Tax=Ramlibacter sp. TaxID=1917967 RepID=UPI003D0E3548